MHETVQRIHAAGSILGAEHAACDSAGKLTAKTVQVLRKSQGMRLLQPKAHGGYQADVTDFYAWIRATAQYTPSAG